MVRQNQTIISVDFDISCQDLAYLMQLHNQDGVKELNETYGGLVGLEKKLQTNLITGLSGDERDILNRQNIFGRNQLIKQSSKSFLRLMFDALNDVTLIILIICSLISFGLTFYHPNQPILEYRSLHHSKFRRTIFEFKSIRLFLSRRNQCRLDRRCSYYPSCACCYICYSI